MVHNMKVPVNEKEINLKRYKKKHGVIKSNTGASLIDLGMELHYWSSIRNPMQSAWILFK